MSLKLRCRSCQTTFLTTKDQVGQKVTCPKCDAEQVVPRPVPRAASTEESVDAPLMRMRPAVAAAAPAAKSSVFLPKDKKGKGPAKEKGSGKGVLIGVIALTSLVIVGLIAYPMIAKWWNPRPDGEVEGIAYDYLQALAKGDDAEVAKIGVVQEPPSIRSFRDLKRDKAGNSTTKGKFGTIANLHRQIEKKFVYDQATGRFTPKDPLGPAAEVLDAGEAAKKKMEKEGTYDKMAGGTPEEQMQAAIDFGDVFVKLSQGVLSAKKLIPTYKMLVENSKPPLLGTELALALDYATHRVTWDALLKRPFPTIKADGPFQFDRAEVTASVMDKLASSGDPPTLVRLKLIRFRMDAINTRWRVVSARRVVPGVPDEPDEDAPDPQTPSEPVKPSPGEIPSAADLMPKEPPGR